MTSRMPGQPHHLPSHFLSAHTKDVGVYTTAPVFSRQVKQSLGPTSLQFRHGAKATFSPTALGQQHVERQEGYLESDTWFTGRSGTFETLWISRGKGEVQSVKLIQVDSCKLKNSGRMVGVCGGV